MKKQIIILEKETRIGGFNFQRGFAAVLENGDLAAATSGWRTEAGTFGNLGDIYIYRPDDTGWKASWEPIEGSHEDLVAAIEQFEIQEARRQRRAEKRARKARAALA